MWNSYMGTARVMIFFLAGFFALSALPSPAKAETLPWHNVEGGRVRIGFVPAEAGEKDNSGYGVIELDLKPGWKTYWSNPGMAPEITFDQPIKADILFPEPQLLKSEGNWAIGYKGHVFLPFRVSLPNPEAFPRISGTVLIGLCSDLCIPEKIPFQFQTNEKADLLTRGKIAAILSDLPEPAHNHFQIRELTAANDGLHVLLRHPESPTAPQLFMDSSQAQLGIATVKTHKDGETLYAVPVLSGHLAPGQPVHYVAVLKEQAISGQASLTPGAGQTH